MRYSVFSAAMAATLLLSTPAAAAGQCSLSTRDVVTRFVDLFYKQKKIREAFKTWVAPDYIRHNPYSSPVFEDTIDAVEAYYADPKASFDVKRVIVDGDLAVVHSFSRISAEDRGSALVDIIRIKDCKIVEHWDVMQEIPEGAVNPMF